MNEQQIDGEIHFYEHDLHLGEHADGLVRGYIFGDRKGRFDDGTFIRTSHVQRVEGQIVHTRNSVYRLVPIEETVKLIAAGRAARS